MSKLTDSMKEAILEEILENLEIYTREGGNQFIGTYVRYASQEDDKVVVVLEGGEMFVIKVESYEG